MEATTIKLENPLLNQLYESKPEGLSLSAFVRELLEREVLQRKMAQAAGQYSEFLKVHPDETVWMEEWEAAPLDKPLQKRRRRSKR